MLAAERRNQIMEALRRDERVLVGPLALQFNVSEETIRRGKAFFEDVILPGLPRQTQNIASMAAGVNCADRTNLYTALEFDITLNMYEEETLQLRSQGKPGIYRLNDAETEFMALVNYGIVGLIQLERGYADTVDMSNEEAMQLYDRFAREALELMKRKNHDYDEAWRDMRVTSYTDLILTKIERIKEIEDLALKGGGLKVSEGIDANYMDIINYSVFGLIKI